METIPSTEVTPHLIRNAIRRRWLLVVAPAVVLAALGAFVGHEQRADYTSVTTILLRPTVANPFSPDSAKSSPQITVAMSTEAGLVTSPPVTDLVNAQLGTDLPPANSSVSTQVPVSTQVVQISATAGSPVEAQDMGAAYAKAYLQYRSAESQKLIDAQVADLTAQVKAATEGLQKATTDADSLNPSADAVARLQLYSNRLATVQDSLTTVKATSSDPGMTMMPATLPTEASGIPGWAYGLAGGILGLGIGFFLALWRERTDPRVRFAEASTVAGVPVLTGWVRDDDLDSDATRLLRASVIRLRPSPAAIAVVPISAPDTDGLSSWVATELARSLSRSGYRVTMVDASGSEGRSTGLSDWLLDRDGTSSLGDLADERDTVWSIGPGTRVQESIDLLAGDRFIRGMRELASTNDYVIVAGSPFSGGGSGADLASVTSAAIAVGTDRSTTLDQVEALVHSMSRTGPELLGLVSMRSAGAGAPKSGSRAALRGDAPSTPHGVDDGSVAPAPGPRSAGGSSEEGTTARDVGHRRSGPGGRGAVDRAEEPSVPSAS